MQLIWWRPTGAFSLSWPENQLIGILAVILYGLLLASVLILRWDELRRWRLRHAFLFALLLILTPFLTGMLTVDLQRSVLLLPGLPNSLPAMSVPLLGSVAAFLAGAWMGCLPAAILGLVSGILRTGWSGGNILYPFSQAVLAGSAAILVRQDYRGVLARWLRQPIVAGLVSAFIALPTVLLAVLDSMPSGTHDIQNLEVLAALVTPVSAALLIEAALGGLALHGAYRFWPTRRPWTRGRAVPAYQARLSQRLVLFFFPMIVVGIIGLGIVVLSVASSTARDLVLVQMKRDANTAASAVPDFFLTGQGLVRQFTGDGQLLDPDPKVRASRLELDLKTVAFFQQLTVVDVDGHIISRYPADGAISPMPEAERDYLPIALRVGAPGETPVYAGPQGSTMTFMAPIFEDSRRVRAVVLGRTELNRNPLLQRAVAGLQGTFGVGRGFLADQRGIIVASPDAKLVLQTWHLAESPNRLPPEGIFTEDHSPAGEPRLVWQQPVRGQPWSVVITVPYEVVQSRSLAIAVPILGLLVPGGILATLGIWILGEHLTRPLQRLAQAADNYANGQLDRPVLVSGTDEVGRLGEAFEHMRQSLKKQLEELSLLLSISQTVATSVELERGLPPILAGARQASGAAGARLMLQLPDYQRPVVIADGPAAEAMAALDDSILALLHSEKLLRLDNLTRTRTLIDPRQAQGTIGALVALPLHSHGRLLGMMWLGYPQPRTFAESELGFLETLAGQAMAVIETDRLFTAVEGGKRRLEAILASTSDPVLVTDPSDRLLLLNPAAEIAFEVRARDVLGRQARDFLPDSELLSLLTGNTGGRTGEVALSGSKTFYASVSVIRGDEGDILGRVAVLHDITALKALDQLKSEFVQTVSHDLRGPLTFMQGYAGMIPTAGPVTERQQEYLDRILFGVEQMSALIDDLLDLGRIEAGVDLAEEPCSVEEIIRDTVENVQPRATQKGLSVHVDLSEPLPLLVGDAALLRQALSNLVENAIKYTVQGKIDVRARRTAGEVIVSVQDTGIGIAPADQARMFEKFFRVRRKDTAHIKGSGLGLAIVRSIAERHGGRAWVESRLGEGSTFYISLPIPSTLGPGLQAIRGLQHE